jgi:hypothetical protein
MNTFAKKTIFGASVTLAFGMLAGCGNTVTADGKPVPDSDTLPMAYPAATLRTSGGGVTDYVWEYTPVGAPDHLCVATERGISCFVKTPTVPKP